MVILNIINKYSYSDRECGLKQLVSFRVGLLAVHGIHTDAELHSQLIGDSNT